MRTLERGFTLIEMLVSVTVFAVILIAVYSLFDQSRWFYLHSEKRANIQDMARLAMEGLERDLRMIGNGVPTAFEIGGGGSSWVPFIMEAGPSSIHFRGDVDSRNTRLKNDASSSPVQVHDAALICENPFYTVGSIPLVIVNDRRTWAGRVCSSYDAGANTVSLNSAVACPPEECEIYTIEHVFYELNGDTNSDGVCDITDYPFCTLEKLEKYGNTPITVADLTINDAFSTFATNVVELRFRYFLATGVETTSPNLAQRIRITLTVRDRSTRPQEYQDVTLASEAIVRDILY